MYYLYNKWGKLNFRILITFICLIVIIASLINMGIELTGRATGAINVTIIAEVNINFSVSEINFGRGNIDLGETTATIDTLGNVINGNWTNVSQGLVIENIGNDNVTLQLATGKNASVLIGGSNPVYQFNVSNIESGSCTQSNVTLGEWVDVNSTSPGTMVCDPFSFNDDRDSIRIDIKIIIPSNSNTGDRTDTITATATTI